MASWDELVNEQVDNMIVAMKFNIWAKRYDADTVEELDEIWTPEDGLMIPTGYDPLGLIAPNTGNFTREQNWTPLESHGRREPSRRINTQDIDGLEVTAQETSRLVLELFNDMDLSGVEPSASGTVKFKKAQTPMGGLWHIIGVAKDGDGPTAKYVVRQFPRAQVTEMGNREMSQEQEIRYPLTFTAYTDPNLGTSAIDLIGGPGWDPERAGFGPAGV